MNRALSYDPSTDAHFDGFDETESAEALAERMIDEPETVNAPIVGNEAFDWADAENPAGLHLMNFIESQADHGEAMVKQLYHGDGAALSKAFSGYMEKLAGDVLEQAA